MVKSFCRRAGEFCAECLWPVYRRYLLVFETIRATHRPCGSGDQTSDGRPLEMGIVSDHRNVV